MNMNARSKDVSVGEWMVTMLLMCIPVVNLIMLFVWAFGGNAATSKSNWAKAGLIWTLIGVAFYVILFALMIAAGGMAAMSAQ